MSNEPDDLVWWLGDAAKILGQNGTTDHADKVRAAASAIKAQAAEIVRRDAIAMDLQILCDKQAAEIERLTDPRRIVGGGFVNLSDFDDMADRAEAAEAKLREAVEVMREAYDDLYEINMSNYDHDEVTRLNEGSVNASLAIRDFLSTMEARDE